MENIPQNETLFTRNFVLRPFIGQEVDSVSEEGRGAAMGTFTAAFDLGIGVGSIILGFVLQYFGFQVMYSLSGMIVLAGAVLLIADNRKASRRT